MAKKSISFFKNSVSFNSSFFFFVFLFSNTSVAYLNLSIIVKLWIGLMGILFPFTIGLWMALAVRFKKKVFLPPYTFSVLENSTDENPPLILWLLFGFLILLTRFYGLTSIPFWPITDEGIFANMALGLLKKWNWSILWGEVHFEPLLIWSLGGFFNLFSPSFLSLRLFSAFLSIATVILSYWASRQLFSKLAAFIFCWLFAFSFWEFSFMRLCAPETLIIFFEFLTLGLLGALIKGKSNRTKWFFITALGISAGIGFYSYLNWAVVWFFTASVLWLWSLGQKQKYKKYFYFYMAVTILLALPWACARLSAGNLNYVSSSFSTSFFHSCIAYFIGLFVDGQSSFPFGPNWGGMFDPVTGSLVLIGGLYAITSLEKKLLGLLSLGLFTFLLPGILSHNLELHRVTPSLPLWMLLAVLGVKSLLTGKTPKNALIGLTVWGLLSLGLNTYNFTSHYCNINQTPADRQWRSVEYFNAYQILKNLDRQNGPIDVFTEWNPDYDNKTLDLACYPFNALNHPQISQNQVSWAAFTVNLDYTPFLKKNFPHVQSRLLNPGLPPADLHHSLGLFLIPVSDISPAVLTQWIKTQKECEEIDFAIKNRNPEKPWSVYEKKFSSLASQQKNDRFLSSILWERAASFPLMDGDFQITALDFKQAIQKGYPAPHLLHNLKLANSLSHFPAQSVQKPQ